MPAPLKYTGSSAVISKCKTYRYELTREWAPLPGRKPKTLAFIMLNPSTADGMTDDPTIKRCVGFARKEGANRLLVANLFAYRTSSPDKLKEDRYNRNIVGPEYWDRLAATLLQTGKGPVVVGWGTNGKLIAQDEAVYQFIRSEGRQYVHCLGVNSEGTPKHPLYVDGATKLRAYEPEKYK